MFLFSFVMYDSLEIQMDAGKFEWREIKELAGNSNLCFHAKHVVNIDAWSTVLSTVLSIVFSILFCVTFAVRPHVRD